MNDDGFRRVRIIATGPYGRKTHVYVDDVEQTDLTSFDLNIDSAGLHMVTLTFPAHVTLQTSEETP